MRGMDSEAFHDAQKYLAQRFGSGDGEREASMTRQMPYEPLPASVLFALGLAVMSVIGHCGFDARKDGVCRASSAVGTRATPEDQ